jgi:hypothetical protein
MKGVEPVASNRRSYSATVPSLAMTSRALRSIFVMVLPRCRVMLFAAYQSTSLSMMSLSVISPASTSESRIRL